MAIDEFVGPMVEKLEYDTPTKILNRPKEEPPNPESRVEIIHEVIPLTPQKSRPAEWKKK